MKCCRLKCLVIVDVEFVFLFLFNSDARSVGFIFSYEFDVLCFVGVV